MKNYDHMNEKAIYPIRFISQQTGLSTHVIRAWERRYAAVRPQRTSTQRRLYSQKDLNRLKMLRDSVAAGNTIAQIAGLKDAELAELAQEKAGPSDFAGPMAAFSDRESQCARKPEDFVNAALDTLKELEPGALEVIVDQASVAFPRLILIEQVLLPLLDKMDQSCAKGDIKLVNVHMATLVLRHFLWEMMRSCQNAANTPVAIGAAPTGQRYEFGALVAMAIAADSGWRSLYCGADLRAEEIASAAAQKQARAAVLSIARTADGVHLKREVKRLRRILPRNCSLIIGGRGAEAIRPILKGTELIMMRDEKDLRSILKGLLVSGQWRPKGAPEDSRCARPEHVAGCTASVMGT